MLEVGVTTALSRVPLQPSSIPEPSNPSRAINFDTSPDFGEYVLKSPFDCSIPTLSAATDNPEALQFDNKVGSLKLYGCRFDLIKNVVDHPSVKLPTEYGSLFAKFMSIGKKARRDEHYIDGDEVGSSADYSFENYNDQELLQNTPGTNPFILISPMEMALKLSSYRPFRSDASPEDRIRRINRELKSLLQNRRNGMRRQWADWDEEFEKMICCVREDWDHCNEKFSSEACKALMRQLRDQREDADGVDRKWSVRLNFGLFHYTEDLSISPVNFMRYADAATGKCVVFITNAGFVGVAPASISQGGRITILSGWNIPVILRREQDYYTFQGLAYVHGIMHGEIPNLDPVASSKFERETFEIR